MAADEAKRESQTKRSLLDGDEVLDDNSYSMIVADNAALSDSYEEDDDDDVEETRKRRGGGVVNNRQSSDVSVKRASSLTLRSSDAGCKLEVGDDAESSGNLERKEQADGGDDAVPRRRRGSEIAPSDARTSDFPERSSSFVLRNATQNKTVIEKHQPEWTGTQ
jgi:hypothetical protein